MTLGKFALLSSALSLSLASFATTTDGSEQVQQQQPQMQQQNPNKRETMQNFRNRQNNQSVGNQPASNQPQH